MKHSILKYEQHPNVDGRIVSALISVVVRSDDDQFERIEEARLVGDELQKVLEDDVERSKVIERLIAQGELGIEARMKVAPPTPIRASREELKALERPSLESIEARKVAIQAEREADAELLRLKKEAAAAAAAERARELEERQTAERAAEKERLEARLAELNETAVV